MRELSRWMLGSVPNRPVEAWPIGYLCFGRVGLRETVCWPVVAGRDGIEIFEVVLSPGFDAVLFNGVCNRF